MSPEQDEPAPSSESTPAGDGTTAATPRGRRPRRATRRGAEQDAGPDVRAWEDDDRAWGDRPSSTDEQLRRDVPPHWG